MTRESQSKAMAEVVFPVEKPAYKANYTRVSTAELYQTAQNSAPKGRIQTSSLGADTDGARLVKYAPPALCPRDREAGYVGTGASFESIFQALDKDSQHLVAELMHRLLATKAGQGAPDRPEASDLSLFLTRWIDYLANANKSQRTCYLYRLILANFLSQFPCPNTIDIDTYFTLLRGRVSAQTRQVEAAALRGFLKFCQQRGFPVQHLIEAIPSVQVHSKRREAAPIESVAAVLSLRDLKPRTKALLYILTTAGPRISEVLNLKRSDVDLKRLSITLMGKGSKQRNIPITRVVALAIREHLATAPRSAYLFPGRKALTWSAHCVQDHLKVLCRRAKVDPFTPHQLRHLAATQLILTGANPKCVSEILGHKDPGITLRVYTHSNEEINRREHQAHDPLAQVLSQMRRPRGRPRQQRKGGDVNKESKKD